MGGMGGRRLTKLIALVSLLGAYIFLVLAIASLLLGQIPYELLGTILLGVLSDKLYHKDY